MDSRPPGWREDVLLGARKLSLQRQRIQSRHRDGYGEDWPISYKELEPYYVLVEAI
jgi:hypothetical protein